MSEQNCQKKYSLKLGPRKLSYGSGNLGQALRHGKYSRKAEHLWKRLVNAVQGQTR